MSECRQVIVVKFKLRIFFEYDNSCIVKYYKCLLCNNEIATKIFSPNDCATPLIPELDDPYGLVKAGTLPVTYCQK